MIVGYHIVFGAYGFWLPNDPRGSWSTFVGSNTLYRAAGGATKTSDPRSLARKEHDSAQRRATKKLLPRAALRFNDTQVRAIGRGFAAYLKESNDLVWACSVMPDHMHMVTGRLSIPAKQLVVQLKGAAIRQLIKEGCHSFADERDTSGKLPKCFVRGQWIVYLEPGEVSRTINYVQQNPIRAGMKSQRWSFVTVRDG